MNMRDSSSTLPLYSQIWIKYRPVILKLMVDSENGAQEYRFMKHEFRDITPKKASGYSFEMKVSRNRAQNDIKNSDTARSLLSVLQRSEKANQLTAESIFQFSLDKDFVLRISQDRQENKVESGNDES